MRMNRYFQVGFVFAALTALAACGNGSTTGGTAGAAGAAGSTGTAGAAGSGGMAATCDSKLSATSDLSGWSESFAADNTDAKAFYDCACTSGNPCALVCNDPAHPGFCAGMAPVACGQCVTCLETTTGSAGCADEYNTCKSN
jgi:hypothetical protein